MAVPIVVRCECGAETRAEAGDVVSCRCGRRYDTGEADSQQLAVARMLRMRTRVFARLGMGFVGLITIGGFVLARFVGAGIGFVAAFVVWWVLVQPRWRRRTVEAIAQLSTTTIPPER